MARLTLKIGIVALASIFTLFGCGNENNDDPNIEHLRLQVNGASNVYYKSTPSSKLPAPTLLSAYVGDFATPGMPHIHLQLKSELLFDQHTYEFELHSMATATGTHNNHAVAILKNRNNNTEYRTETRLTFLKNNLVISEFGQPSGWIRGDFDIDLCLVAALNTQRCEVAGNTINLKGHFSLLRDPDALAITQGTQQTPFDLGSSPIVLNPNTWNTVNGSPSFYQLNIDPNNRYRIYIRSNNVPLELSVYDNASFTASLCTSVIQNDNTYCEISGTNNNRIYLKIDPSAFSQKTVYFQIEAFNAGPYISEGTYQNPILMGSIDGETLSIAGTVSNSPATIPDGSALPSYRGISFYQLKVQAGHNYGFRLSAIEQVALDLYVLDSRFRLLCAANRDSLCPVYSVENTINLAVVSNDLYRPGGRYRINATIHEGEYFERQGSITQPRVLLLDYEYRGATGYGTNNMSHYVFKTTDNVETVFHVDKITTSLYEFTVFDDAKFENSLCQIRFPNTRCVARSRDNDQSIYLRAISTAPGGMRFSLHPYLGGKSFTNEGSANAPISLGSAQNATTLLSNREVGIGTSFYSVTVAPNTVYTVTLRSNNNMISFTTHEAPALTTFQCRGLYVNPLERQCAVAPSSDQLYINVNGSNTANGDTFNLKIESGGNVYQNEGGPYTPIQLPSSPSFAIQGNVGVGESYYTFAGQTGIPQRVRLSNIEGGNVSLQIRNPYTAICDSDQPGFFEESCDLLPPTQYTTYIIAVSGKQTASGASYQLSVDAIP